MDAEEIMTMPTKKTETVKTKKAAAKPGKAATAKPVKTAKAKAAKPATKPAKAKAPERPVVIQPPRVREVIQVEPKPSARTCPLVLDGIMAAEGFSPRECFSCDEFDCRFYAAEESSGVLGSRLFASEERDDDFDDDDDDGSGGGFYDDAGMDEDDDYDDMR